MKIRLLIVCIIFCCYGLGYACSSAIISGSATPDGRPLLWKHRDAREEKNDARYFHGEKYDFIGLVNTQDTTSTQVWMGGNSAGFCILDTNAYNLDKGKIYGGPMDLEGYFMKEALSRCATLADFEGMLEATRGRRGTLANFGVIDAHGGAAYYETSPNSDEKYDVNDPKIAPLGYLLRTNFGFSGKGERGSGYIRYQTLEELFFRNRQNNNLTAEFLLLVATRCLRNSILETDLYTGDLPENSLRPHYVLLRDYIVRDSSVSTMVIQGAREGEDPRLTTLWTIPGFQLTALTVPLWVAAGDELPEVVISREGRPAPLADYSLRLKEKCFPLKVREGRDYLDLGAILNKKGDGILQKILRQDQKNIAEAAALLTKWQKGGFNKKEALVHYKTINQAIMEFYKSY